MHHVVIGNGVAGINAANEIRNRDEEARISVVSFESEHFFSRTALMYVACGQLSERCVEPFQRDHYERMQFERVHDRVSRLNADTKSLSLQSGSTVTYDRLLIASGSVPATVPWPGLELDGVGSFVSWQDLEWFRERMKTARRAVVVGGGLIGIESVEVLLKEGIETTFLIREPYYWPIALSEQESALISAHMRDHGCDVRLSTEMSEILGKDGSVIAVKTKQGEQIDADMVVIAIGVRPQTDWLRESGIELGSRGGIVVDDHLATNLPDVWAAGDCAEVIWFNGIRRPEQLWYTSRDQGRVAGLNMCGDKKEYQRGIFYNSAKFFDIEYTTAGYVNFGMEGEQEWFYQEPDTLRTVRLVSLPGGELIGFNGLGRRWDHRVLIRWIKEKRILTWVQDHLAEALFDEEFMPAFKSVGASREEGSCKLDC